ncbi:MAG: SAM-dependent methyltransferase [Ruminococcaceae bacterium]|nr:SAM-dependent methyltransferase [Oscillospiraceae bacterium]
MRKQDASTLTLFLSGLAGRYRENRDYFNGIEFTFTSGRKSFRGRAARGEGEALRLSFNGQSRQMDFTGFTKFYTEEAMKYDSAVLEYLERGATMIIEADERGVRSRQTDTKRTETVAASSVLPDRDYIIKASDAPELLKAIGIMSADGKIRNNMIRKYNQIDHFLELVRPLLEEDDSDTITVLDCGCGKSYLSFVLNYFIRDVLRRRCRITGVDIAPGVIEASRKTAEQLGYANMEFICADLRTYQADRPSMVISLHACDTATDMAMGLAVRSGAKSIACVPCCHHELLGQYQFPGLSAITRHGVFAARFNDLFTDGLRMLKLESMGYKTSVVEYISPLDTPKNLLITARKVADSNPEAKREYDELCRTLRIFPAIERECLPEFDEA